MKTSILLSITMSLLLTACGGSSGSIDDKQLAIQKITKYASDGITPPMVQDYIDAGVSGITSDNLLEINEVVESLTAEDVDTTEEMQSLADQLGINIEPTANAGDDKTVQVNQSVTITGSGTDADGSIANYEWKKGNTVLVSTTSFSYTPTVVGTDTLTLMVTDDDGATATDTVNVVVTPVPNQVPTANAGDDITAKEGEVVSLDGTGSTDTDGEIIKYQWKEKSGLNLILSDTNSARPSFSAPSTLKDQVVEFELTVTDDKDETSTDSVLIYIDNNLPEKPNDVIAIIGDKESTIQWDDTPDDVVTYDICQSEEPITDPKNCTSHLNSKVYLSQSSPSTIDELENGKTYYFSVLPEDFEGYGVPSDIIYTTPASKTSQEDKIIAKYNLTTDGIDSLEKSSDMVILNAEFIDDSLYLNGIYDAYGPIGSRVSTPILDFDYSGFSFTVSFYPLEFGLNNDEYPDYMNNIITGGSSYRWISISKAKPFEGHDESLLVSFNNGTQKFFFDDVNLSEKQWHRVSLSFDLSQKRASIMFDGRFLQDILLPDDFVLDVIGTLTENYDKELLFTNFSNGDVLHGYVKDLSISNLPLTKPELASFDYCISHQDQCN